MNRRAKLSIKPKVQKSSATNPLTSSHTPVVSGQRPASPIKAPASLTKTASISVNTGPNAIPTVVADLNLEIPINTPLILSPKSPTKRRTVTSVSRAADDTQGNNNKSSNNPGVVAGRRARVKAKPKLGRVKAAGSALPNKVVGAAETMATTAEAQGGTEMTSDSCETLSSSLSTLTSPASAVAASASTTQVTNISVESGFVEGVEVRKDVSDPLEVITALNPITQLSTNEDTVSGGTLSVTESTKPPAVRRNRVTVKPSFSARAKPSAKSTGQSTASDRSAAGQSQNEATARADVPDGQYSLLDTSTKSSSMTSSTLTDMTPVTDTTDLTNQQGLFDSRPRLSVVIAETLAGLAETAVVHERSNTGEVDLTADYDEERIESERITHALLEEEDADMDLSSVFSGEVGGETTGASASASGETVSSAATKKGSREKRRKVVQSKEPLDPDKMSMRDLLYWNPVANPMKNKAPPRRKPSKVTKTEKGDGDGACVPVVSVATQQEEPVPVGPQVRIDENGEIVIDEESLRVNTVVDKVTIPDGPVILESVGDYSSSSKYRKKPICRTTWTQDETDNFYRALSYVGTDFLLMTSLFPGRNRDQVKNKFKREERVNKSKIDLALRGKLQFDAEPFEKPPPAEPKQRAVKKTQKESSNTPLRSSSSMTVYASASGAGSGAPLTVSVTTERISNRQESNAFAMDLDTTSAAARKRSSTRGRPPIGSSLPYFPPYHPVTSPYGPVTSHDLLANRTPSAGSVATPTERCGSVDPMRALEQLSPGQFVIVVPDSDQEQHTPAAQPHQQQPGGQEQLVHVYRVVVPDNTSSEPQEHQITDSDLGQPALVWDNQL